MILTCPDCATSYYVPDAAVGQGRKVRCATCGYAWRARPEDDEDTPVPVEPPRRKARAASAEAEPEAYEEAFESDEDLYADPLEAEASEAGEPEAPAEEPPLVAPLPQPRARAREPLGPRAIQALAWGGVAAVLVLIAAGLAVFREDVARLWPPSAGAYARVGLPVNVVGLTLQEVRYTRLSQAGRPSLVVSGVMTNIRKAPVSPPPLSIVLFDKGGHVLTGVTSSGAASALAPGAARSFQVTLADPPSAASELEVTFVTGGRGPVAAR
jgi:predicted Zn finger-like uncharacterized protein